MTSLILSFLSFFLKSDPLPLLSASPAQKVVEFTVFPAREQKPDIGYWFAGTRFRVLDLIGLWWKLMGVCGVAHSLVEKCKYCRAAGPQAWRTVSTFIKKPQYIQKQSPLHPMGILVGKDWKGFPHIGSRYYSIPRLDKHINSIASMLLKLLRLLKRSEIHVLQLWHMCSSMPLAPYFLRSNASKYVHSSIVLE